MTEIQEGSGAVKRHRRSAKYQNEAEQHDMTAAPDLPENAGNDPADITEQQADAVQPVRRSRKHAADSTMDSEKAIQTEPLRPSGQNHRTAQFGQKQSTPGMQTPVYQTGYVSDGYIQTGYGVPQEQGKVRNSQPSWGSAPGPVPQQYQQIPDQAEAGPNNGWAGGYAGYDPAAYRSQEQPVPVPPSDNGYRQGYHFEGPDNEPEQHKRSGWRIVLTVLGIIVAAVVCVVSVRAIREFRRQAAIDAAVAPYNALYCEGVYVDGIALGGMTQEEAAQAVTAQVNQRTGEWSVRLTQNGTLLREIRTTDLGISVDVNSALEAAWHQGHDGDSQTRYDAMQALKESPFEAYTTIPSTDTAVIDGILASLATEMYVEPQDARMLSFNPDASYPFTFEPEVVGQYLDTATVRDELYHMVSTMTSGEIELVPESLPPAVTVEYLKTEVYALRGTGSTPISSTSPENRNANIRHAFEFVSGTVIQPGKQFSFNGVVGQRTEKNGFLPAIEYVYNELADGIGGGVCQASTTIYLAAVRANLQIVKREPHSMAVNYTDYGKDATVYWYSNHKIDLVFQNNTELPIYITAAVQSDPKKRTRQVCNVNIYGQGLGADVTYDIVTRETVIPAPEEPEIIRDKNGKYVTYTDEQFEVRKASDGMSVESWRVMYVKGKEVSREFLYTDIYKEKAQQIYVGIKERPEN